MTRIALDVHMIGARETGNETYATELAAALGRLAATNICCTRRGRMPFRRGCAISPTWRRAPSLICRRRCAFPGSIPAWCVRTLRACCI